MINAMWTAGLAVLAALTLNPAAQAQAPGQTRPGAYSPAPASSPTYSPYLNLLRPGNVANNYYGLVRPQLEFRNAVNNLQQQYGTLNQEVNTAANQAGQAVTGHGVSFMNTGRYYAGLGANRAGAGSGTGAGPGTGTGTVTGARR